MPLDIRNIHGPLRVLAGPGTGKTHLLVDLYEQAVRSGEADRSQILVLTFSTGAAGELASRIEARLQDDYGEVWISTFHSFCLRLWREWRPDPKRLQLNGLQETMVMRQVLSELDPSVLGALAGVRRSEAFARDLLNFVSLMKQNLVHPSALLLAAESSASARLQSLAVVYQAYQQRLEAGRMVDFRDLIMGAVGLLSSDARLLERMRTKFRLVLVDEFQDVDPAQFALLRMLAPPESRPRLVVVGDPDQSIYGFRGTVPRLLSVDFARVYGGETVTLAECRRCAQEVLDAGERLLVATQGPRAPRTLREARDIHPAPPAMVVGRESDAVDEAFFCAREIKRLLATSRDVAPGDIAILLRSTTALGAPYEEALRALGVPFEVRGLGAGARNEVVRFLYGYLDSLRRPDDAGAFQASLASTLGPVRPATLSRLRAHAYERGRPLLRVMKRLMAFLAARDQGREEEEGSKPPDYLEFLTEDEIANLRAAMEARDRMLREAERLPIAALAYQALITDGAIRPLLEMDLVEEERVEAMSNLRAAIEGLEGVEDVFERLHGRKPLLADLPGPIGALLAAASDDTEAVAATGDAVQIMTVHQAKGLQFEYVFCAGFAHGLFPVSARPHPLLDDADRAWLEAFKVGFMPSWPSDPDGHAAEEARLAYVALTRARRRVHITYADSYLRQAGPSVFLDLASPVAEVLELSRASTRLEPASLLLAREAEVMIASTRAHLDPLASERARSLGLDVAFLSDPQAGEPFEPYGGDRNPIAVEISHFSPTTLNDYLKCPRLYWYNHHPGLVAEPRSVLMERGGFLHEVLEDFHALEPEWRPLDAEKQREWLDQTLQRHLDGYLSRMEGVLDRRREEHQVRNVLGNYIRFATGLQRVRRLGTVALEKRFHLQLDGVEIVGKIDRVNDVGDGQVEVVDYKTGAGKSMRWAYESYFGPELYDVQLALYYMACRYGFDDDGNPLGFRPRFLSLWYPKEWVWGSIREVIFSVGQPAGLKEYRERLLSDEDLERSRSTVMAAIARIQAGRFEPAPRDLAGTCVSRYSNCPHASICPYGGQPPE
ncbi:MAG TPA: ATP-dependent DNA helicase [Candidatus Dormibacteraeota bacterium]|nr:ATP-dependent DNA helicase [Candidatus Dormibacteraeota bacterium]